MTHDPQNPNQPGSDPEQQDVFAPQTEATPAPTAPVPAAPIQEAVPVQNVAPSNPPPPPVQPSPENTGMSPSEALAPENFTSLTPPEEPVPSNPVPVEVEAPLPQVEEGAKTVSDQEIEDDAPVDPFLKKDDDGGEGGEKPTDRLVPTGDIVYLEKIAPGLKMLSIGLGWDAPEKTDDVYDVDLDASFFVIGAKGLVRSDVDFIFYNNLSVDEGMITHSGDNKDGLGEGDDEKIDLQLEKFPFDIDKAFVSVSIHNAEERFQDFTIVKNAHIRCVDLESNKEIFRYEIPTNKPKSTAFVVGELRRDIAEGWMFIPYASNFENGLYGIARHFGVRVLEP